MRKAREPTYSFVILTAVLVVINIIVARLSVAALPAGTTGVALLYFAVGVMILATLWFGAYGAIAAYAGTLVGSGLLASNPSIPPVVALYWSVAGLLQVLIPLVAFRSFEADPNLENRRDWTILLVFGVLLNNIVGAAWGAWTLALGGVIQPADIGGVFFTWLVGNIIVCLLILPLGLRFMTPKFQRSKLFVKHYWD